MTSPIPRLIFGQILIILWSGTVEEESGQTQMALAHIIEFASAAERKRAIKVFLEVRDSRLVLPGHRMVVTNEHIRALERENIRFSYLSKTAPNGKKATVVPA